MPVPANPKPLTDRQRQHRQETLAEIFQRLDNGESAVVTSEQVSEADDDLWELTIAGIEFSGWLGAICGLLSICRLDIRRGDAVTGEGVNGFGDRCVSGKFRAYFDVRLDRSVVPMAANASAEEHAAANARARDITSAYQTLKSYYGIA
jgi:hypothetical protein